MELGANKKVIVRTETGRLSKKEKERITDIFPQEQLSFDVRHLHHEMAFSYHFRHRVNSVLSASQLLINSSDLKEEEKQQLSAFSSALQEPYYDQLLVLLENDFYEFKKVFQEYLAKQVFILNNKLKIENAQELLAIAEKYTASEAPRFPMVTLTQLDKDTDTVVQIDVPKPSLSPQQVTEFKNIKAKDNKEEKPEWYKNMPSEEQSIFKKFVNDLKPNQIESLTFSSRARNIPGLANYSDHYLFHFDKSGKLIGDINETAEKWLFNSSIRSSIVTPRDMVKRGEEDSYIDKVTLENIKEIVKNEIKRRLSDKPQSREAVIAALKTGTFPILLQTLVNDSMLTEDQKLLRFKERAMNQLKENGFSFELGGNTIKVDSGCFYSTNHPFTKYFRIVDPTRYWGKFQESRLGKFLGIGKYAQEGLKLADLSQTWGKEHSSEAEGTKTSPSIGQLTGALKSLIKRSAALSHLLYSGSRELFIASYEHLLVAKREGIFFGSCVSGKDRKAIELIHTDAMIIYYQKYKNLPNFADSARIGSKRKNWNNFVNIFAELYVSRHQHEQANQNAPGCSGTKNVDMYVPRDMQKAINLKYAQMNQPHELNSTKIDDKLASLNDLDKIPLGGIDENTILGDYGAFKQKTLSEEVSRSTSELQKGLKPTEDATETETKRLRNELTKLKEIIKSDHWEKQSREVPKGIEEMQSLFPNKTTINTMDDNVLKATFNLIIDISHNSLSVIGVVSIMSARSNSKKDRYTYLALERLASHALGIRSLDDARYHAIHNKVKRVSDELPASEPPLLRK